MTPTLGKTIQIFLSDENPRGVKIAKFTSWTIQAVLAPRAFFPTVYPLINPEITKRQ